ncbi:putative reverse transcriptase domain-containing protein [Tanacetum coccineum]
MFRISNCSVENQINFSICTLLGSALTWWNSHVKTVGHDVAYAMTWTNLHVKGIDVVGYNQRFQDLALMCARMFLEESDKIEKYVGGLHDMIHGINKRQNTGMDYAAWSGEKKPYGGSKPLCSKCNYHHDGQKPTCYECGAQGHFKRECPKLKNNNRGNHGGNGCPVFLAHVTTKETEDKLKKKRLEDVPIIRYFPEVFPEDLSVFTGLDKRNFQIDLIPGEQRVDGHPIVAPVRNE